jgi:cephalosporin hydroxylase
MGIPVIQMPNDILVIQELIYNEKPDLILECGIGHGGMLVFYSSILNLISKKNTILLVWIFLYVR